MDVDSLEGVFVTIRIVSTLQRVYNSFTICVKKARRGVFVPTLRRVGRKAQNPPKDRNKAPNPPKGRSKKATESCIQDRNRTRKYVLSHFADILKRLDKT